MGSKSEKMYKNSPKMERDEEGNMSVKHSQEESDADAAGTSGVPVEVHQAHERHSMQHRHSTELMAMHHNHEVAHASHDAVKKGGKEHLHSKHEEEHKSMMDRHHKEMKHMHAKHEKGDLLEPTHKESPEPKAEAKGGKGTEEKTHAEKDGKHGESAKKKTETSESGEKK